MVADRSLEELLDAIAAQKAELDAQRRRAPGGLRHFEHSQDLELTYTSNAIEGNTLTAAETTLVVEQGITVAGKPLRDHLEAIDHFEAIRYVRALARTAAPPTESDVRQLHRLVMLRSDPERAGRYADQGRYVLTDAGRHAFPSPAEVPALMGDFARWLATAADTPGAAFDAHRRLVDIHPFNDGKRAHGAADEPAADPRRLPTGRGAPAGPAGVSGGAAHRAGRRSLGVRQVALREARRDVDGVCRRCSAGAGYRECKRDRWRRA